jgi:hypothetical protein
MRKPIILIILLFLLSGATLGQDPWKAPKNTYTSADLDKAPPVTYCELTQNSETYRDKIVRVRGIYTWDSEMSYLYDRVCSKDAPPKLPAEGLSSETWVWFDRQILWYTRTWRLWSYELCFVWIRHHAS